MEILIPIARFKAFLVNGISETDTSLTIDKSTDTDGNTLSGKYFIVIDKKKTNREYMAVTFSGANGTMTLAERGISLVDGKTASASRRFAHDKGATVEIVDYPYLTRISRQLKAQDELENIPVVPSSVAAAQTGTIDKELATVDYVKKVSFAGAPDATTAQKGISRISVAPVNPTIPISVGDNDPRVPTQDENDALQGTDGTPSNTNRYVTSSDVSVTPAANRIPRANVSNKIDNGWLNIGTGANQIVALNGSGQLPAVSGELLTNVPLPTLFRVPRATLYYTSKPNPIIFVYFGTIQAGILGTNKGFEILGGLRMGNSTSGMRSYKVLLGGTIIASLVSPDGKIFRFRVCVMNNNSATSQIVTWEDDSPMFYLGESLITGTSSVDTNLSLSLALTYESNRDEQIDAYNLIVRLI